MCRDHHWVPPSRLKVLGVNILLDSFHLFYSLTTREQVGRTLASHHLPSWDPSRAEISDAEAKHCKCYPTYHIHVCLGNSTTILHNSFFLSYTHIYTYISYAVYIHTHIYTHIYTHAYIYVHTHTHINVHIYVCVLIRFGCVWLFATLWTVALLAPLSIGFSTHEHWSGLPRPPQRGSSQTRDQTRVSYVSCIGRLVLYYYIKPFVSVKFSGIKHIHKVV